MIKYFLLLFLFMSAITQSQFYDFKKADDTLHLAGGAFIGTGALIFNKNILKIDCQWCVATTAGLAAGGLKEWYDSSQPYNRFDVNKMLVSGLGGFIAWGLYKIGIPPYITMGVSLGYIGFRMAVNL